MPRGRCTITRSENLTGWIMGGTRMRASKEELRIGGIFSLSGYLSWSGNYKRKAAELKAVPWRFRPVSHSGKEVPRQGRIPERG